MAPTICSGKKRQTRAIATTNIRRHEQGSHQLNQTLSNIVNYVARSSINPRVSGSSRTRTENQRERNGNTAAKDPSLNFNYFMQTSATSGASSSNHRHTQLSFISDNAVTSSTHSDTENSFDLRLTNGTFRKDATALYDSNKMNGSSSTSLSLSSTSLSESELDSESTFSSTSPHKETSSSSSPLCEERIFKRYSNIRKAAQEEGSNRNNDVRYLYEADNDNASAANMEEHQLHSSNIKKHFYACNYYDSVADSNEGYDLEGDIRENSDISDGNNSDLVMDTEEEAESMTSLDTEKSAKLKRSNHHLLRDKLLTKTQTNNNNTKSLTNPRNTDGLLSIAIKTIKLVKRNQLLQQRLTQLQLETSEFIQSVLANPENRHFRQNIKQKVEKVEKV